MFLNILISKIDEFSYDYKNNICNLLMTIMEHSFTCAEICIKKLNAIKHLMCLFYMDELISVQKVSQTFLNVFDLCYNEETRKDFISILINEGILNTILELSINSNSFCNELFDLSIQINKNIN